MNLSSARERSSNISKSSVPATGEESDQPKRRVSKSPLLTIILNHIYWSTMRAPSGVQLARLSAILKIAKESNVIAKSEPTSEADLQRWFRNKRFNTRQALSKVLQKDKVAVRMFEVIASSFETANLAKVHELIV